MIEELKQKVLFAQNVPDVAQGALGASLGTAGVAGLTGWIDLFSSTFSIVLALAGFIVTVLSGINLWHKIKQSKIKTERDRLELEQLRKQLRDMVQKD